MNTPKSRKPKRYSFLAPTVGQNPTGNYLDGIHNDRFAILFAKNAAFWVHLEDAMIEVFRDLLGFDQAPARQIFKSVVSNKARKMVMLACLEQAKVNVKKSDVYDLLIEEFSKLNTRRNTYVHGLWYTHLESGRMFVSEESSHDFHWLATREVPYSELEGMHNLMTALAIKIQNRAKPNWVTVKSSPEIQRQQRSAGKKADPQENKTSK